MARSCWGSGEWAASSTSPVIASTPFRALSGVARLLTSEEARSARIELELEAMCWIERHGELAYGLARERIHEPWRNGDHEAAERWQAIRTMVARFQGRTIGPGPERD